MAEVLNVYLQRIVSPLLFVLGRHLELLEVVLGVHHGGIDVVHVQRGSELGPGVLLLDGPGPADQSSHDVIPIWSQVSVASLDSPEPCLLENMMDLHEDNTIRHSFEKIQTLSLCFGKLKL